MPFHLPIGEVDLPFVRSVSGFMNAIKANVGASAADDCGSLTCWREGDEWVAEFHRYYRTIGECRVRTKRELRCFLSLWFPYLTKWGCPGDGQ